MTPITKTFAEIRDWNSERTDGVHPYMVDHGVRVKEAELIKF